MTKFYYQTANLGTSRPIFVEKPNGYGTFYQYDASGNVIAVTEGAHIQSINGDGSLSIVTTDFKTTYAYDSKGRVIKITDPTGRAVEYVYDNAGNVIKVKDGLLNTQSTGYVTRGGMTTTLVSNIEDALGRAVTYGYDVTRDLVTSITNALGATHYTYDSRYRQTEVTDAAGRKTQFVYNAKDQLTSVVEAGNLATATDDIIANFAYNALGQLVSITGPLGAVTQFGYDLAGRLINFVIGEDAKNYCLIRNIMVADLEEDTSTITFNLDSSVNQAEIFYKKKTDTVYQSFSVPNIAAGDNQVTLEGLSGNTEYNFEIRYRDNAGDISYSRKYDFTTKAHEMPAGPATATVQSVSDNTASVKIEVSEDIQSAKIRYHVRGETTNRTVIIEGVRNAMAEGVIFDLVKLRSGQIYDAEITFINSLGEASRAKMVSFRTSGAPTGYDAALRGETTFGKVLAALQDQAFISMESNMLADPFAEQYNFVIRDSHGNVISSATATYGIHDVLGKNINVTGLTADSQYIYTLVTTSRQDIAPVTGTFRTASGSDTVYPDITSPAKTSPINFLTKEDSIMFLSFGFTEALKMFEIVLTEYDTQSVKRYYFFNLPAATGPYNFLLEGASPDESYNVRWFMVDMSGNAVSETLLQDGQPSYGGIKTPIISGDETPPHIVSNTVVSRTNTTINMRVTTNEECDAGGFTVRYRAVGSTQWVTTRAKWMRMPGYYWFAMSVMSDQLYEYQYVFKDKYGNQFITDWMVV